MDLVGQRVLVAVVFRLTISAQLSIIVTNLGEQLFTTTVIVSHLLLGFYLDWFSKLYGIDIIGHHFRRGLCIM